MNVMSIDPSFRVPAIGIGTYDADPVECREAVEHALNVGYRHVDTAQYYENEAAAGDALAAADVDREDVVLATKVDSRNLAYEDAVETTLASRDRLGVDAIDLLYVHWPIRSYDPEATLRAFDELHDRGVIDHVGLSNFTPDLLRDAMDRLDAPVVAHQVECHVLLQQPELRRLAREYGHSLVAYSPLAKGAALEVPAVREAAAAHDATAAQVALAWLLSKDPVRVIPKSTDPDHVEENLAARDLTLSASAIERIDALDREERQVDFPAAPWN